MKPHPLPDPNHEVLPPWESIPEPYRRGRSPWNTVDTIIKFHGWPNNYTLRPVPGLDLKAAESHVRALRSLRVKSAEERAHVSAAIAWAIESWFSFPGELPFEITRNREKIA